MYIFFFKCVYVYTHAHTHTQTRESPKFYNIFVTWGTIHSHGVLFLGSWRWQITVGLEISSTPHTFRVLFTVFASMAWSTTSESTILGLLDIACSSRSLQPERNFFNHLVIVLWSIASSSFPQQIFLIASQAFLARFKFLIKFSDLTQKRSKA